MDFYWYQMISYRPGPSSTACWRVVTWFLTFEVGRQHFRLYWISGQTFEWFGGLFKNLAICIKYYELRLALLLFWTAFLYINKLWKETNVSWTTPCLDHANCFSTFPARHACAAFNSICFLVFFYKQLEAENWLNRAVFKSHPKISRSTLFNKYVQGRLTQLQYFDMESWAF